MFEIAERDVPEQFVLTHQGRVRAEGLAAWIGEALQRLKADAEPLGGIAGRAFVVYHGRVDEDADGPVEACVPVASPGGLTRSEPAHREAYVRLTRAQVAFPQILDAYAAVERWAGERGISAAGPPREVYFADFMRAGAEDPVCDVALPIAA